MGLLNICHRNKHTYSVLLWVWCINTWIHPTATIASQRPIMDFPGKGCVGGIKTFLKILQDKDTENC